MDPKRRFCFVYKTTNIVNGKYYVGCHCTFKLDDGYLGSGMRIQRAIKKYGRENFTLEIIQFFDTREDALAKEKELITLDLLKDPMCMNIQPGGGGGFAEATRLRGAKTGLERTRWLRANDPNWKAEDSKRRSEANRKWKKPKIHFDWTGHKHKPETIEKMRRAKKPGSAAAQIGMVWIHRIEPFESIRVKREELETMIAQGWAIGRTPKKIHQIVRKNWNRKQWMNDGARSIMVDRETVDQHIQEGWSIGRK